ncbi:MAG: RNA polymerase sigma factor [Peptococcaceae bacterium]
MNEANRILAGTEKSAFVSQMYKQYYAKIFKYTLYRVGDRNTAEDLVSEVFEKVWIKYYTFNPQKAKFSTWLFTIANNTIIDYLKKNNRQGETVCLEKVAAKYRLEDVIIHQELKEYLLKAISCLDERQKNIISLKFAACLTNREIARMLDLTESNVGTILYRSLKQLRDILKEQEIIC